MDPNLKTLLVMLVVSAVTPSHAEIFKHVDSAGQVTYSDTPMAGARPAELPALSVIETDPVVVPAPVQVSPQQAMQEMQRRWLKERLAEEQLRLDSAVAAMQEAAQIPEVYQTRVVGSNGVARTVTRRAVARYEEKMAQHQADVDRIHDSIDTLRRELGRVPDTPGKLGTGGR